MKHDIKILVVGDDQVGKSSLISSFISDCFTEEVPSLMMDTVLPPSTTVYGVRTTLVDSAGSDRDGLRAKLRAADCVIVLYDASRPATLNSVTTTWLPLIRSSIANSNASVSRGLGGSAGASAPGASPRSLFSPSARASPMVITPAGSSAVSATKMAIVAAAKTDLVPGFELRNDPWVSNLLRDFPFVACVTSCSSRNLDVKDLFDLGARLAAFPVSPLMDLAAQRCTPDAARAFRRIFRIYDRDHDGLWSDFELNAFQMSGGWDDLKLEELVLLKQKLGRCFDHRSQGLREDKITFEGFFMLMQQYIKDLRMEVPWKVLRVHNYDDKLRLLLPDLIFEPPLPISADRSTYSLTAGAVDFLTSLLETTDPATLLTRETTPTGAADPEWWTPILLREPLSVFPETFNHPWRVRLNEKALRPPMTASTTSPQRSELLKGQYDSSVYRNNSNMSSFNVSRTPSSALNAINLVSATNSDDAASVGGAGGLSDAASVVSNSESVSDFAVTHSGVMRRPSTESEFGLLMSQSYDPLGEKSDPVFKLPFDVYEDIDSGFLFHIRTVRDRDSDASECLREPRFRCMIADWLTEWHMLVMYRPMLVKELLFRLGYVARDCGVSRAPSSLRLRCSVRRSPHWSEDDGEGASAGPIGAGLLMDRFNLLSPSRYSSDVYFPNGQHFLPPSTTHVHICVVGGHSVDATKYELLLSVSRIVTERGGKVELSSSFGNLSTGSNLSSASEEQQDTERLSDEGTEKSTVQQMPPASDFTVSEKYGGRSVTEMGGLEALIMNTGVNVSGCRLWIDAPPSTRCHWTQPAHMGSPFSAPISLHVVMSAVPCHATAMWLRDHGKSVDLALVLFQEGDRDSWRAVAEIDSLLDAQPPVPRQYVCINKHTSINADVVVTDPALDTEDNMVEKSQGNVDEVFGLASAHTSKENLRPPIRLDLLADGSFSEQDSKTAVEACIQVALDTQERGIPLRLRQNKGLLRRRPFVVIPFACGLLGLPLAYYFLGEIRTWTQGLAVRGNEWIEVLIPEASRLTHMLRNACASIVSQSVRFAAELYELGRPRKFI